jgi:hypothetical protein
MCIPGMEKVPRPPIAEFDRISKAADILAKFVF